MTDYTTPPDQEQPVFPKASMHRRHFSAIWLIPILAGLIAGYLGIRSYTQQGDVITISFRTADGLSVGQTAVKYKAVTLGTVEGITLNKDMTGVNVRVHMMAHTNDLLTDHARFWVERPRLTSANLTDIVSGTYIQVDPGAAGGTYQNTFVGLENQPSLPADEQGTTYVLHANRIGSLTDESPVYFRDVNVGKVLGVDIGDGFGPVTVNVFVRAPYDKFVKPTSHFWNASGFSVKVGAGGLHVELQSLQSALSGGVAFDTPVNSAKAAQADPKMTYTLYTDHKAADSAAFSTRVPCVTYVQNSIKDLGVGSPVQMFGIEVGEVTDVKLTLDPQNNDAKVRVAFEIEPERAFGNNDGETAPDTAQIMRQLVQNGMRVRMESSDLIAGQEILALEFTPKTQPATISMESDAMVLPGQGGGLDSLDDAIGDIAGKLQQIPFDEIGKNLNHLLASADQTIGGPDMKQAVHSLAITMSNAEDVSRTAKENLSPALKKLPDISAQLQNAVAQANAFMSSVNNGYGGDSDFQRDAKRTLDQVNDAARSIRLLADYLDRHPEALIQGKTSQKDKP
jgi:paraquat-inducible protein B